MPLFEYICKKCGVRFEFLVLGAKQPKCPSCRSAELEQVFSAFSTSSGGKGNGSASLSKGGGCGPSFGGG